MIRESTVLLLLLVVACSVDREQAAPSGSADSVAILRTFDSAITQIVHAPDPVASAEAYVRFHTANAVLMIPGIPAIVGHDSIYTFVLGFFRDYRFAFPEWQTRELVVSGDWAFHRFAGVGVMTPKAGGQPIREDRKYLDIWHREPNGAWRIARHIFNLNQ